MENNLKQEVIQLLKPRLDELGVPESDVDMNESLLSQGILDSMSFLEFTVELESKFDVEFDFSESDPSEFTSIENIVKHIQNGK